MRTRKKQSSTRKKTKKGLKMKTREILNYDDAHKANNTHSWGNKFSTFDRFSSISTSSVEIFCNRCWADLLDNKWFAHATWRIWKELKFSWILKHFGWQYENYKERESWSICEFMRLRRRSRARWIRVWNADAQKRWIKHFELLRSLAHFFLIQIIFDVLVKCKINLEKFSNFRESSIGISRDLHYWFRRWGPRRMNDLKSN